jgi:hypothetical protein
MALPSLLATSLFTFFLWYCDYILITSLSSGPMMMALAGNPCGGPDYNARLERDLEAGRMVLGG